MKNYKKLPALVIVLAAIAISTGLYKPVQATNKTGIELHSAEDQNAHKGHKDEKSHEIHEEAKGHEHEEGIRLSKEEMAEFGIEVRTALPGPIKIHVNLPGEVTINADRLAHAVPSVAGIVREVRKTMGEKVLAGEVMAVLESRELADTKSAYLAAKERTDLALSNFRREKELWIKKIASEQEYLKARQTLAEVRIELRSAEQKLHALGFSETFLEKLPTHSDVDYTRYEIRAPFNGTVIKKHIAIGELLNEESEAFVIADLDTVWVNLNVYQKDLPFIQIGQKANISAGRGLPDAEGTISYLGPIIEEKTRTATARVVLPNKDGRWKPGLFINAEVTVSEIEAAVAVPRTAIHTLGNQPAVFVATAEGFKPRAVSLGRSDKVNIEVLTGLQAGERYVNKGAFTLKAEIEKESFGEGHEH